MPGQVRRARLTPPSKTATAKTWGEAGVALVRQGAIGLGLLSLSACAASFTQGPDPGQQIAALEQRLLEAEKRAIVGEIESSRLRRRVHELEEELAQALREAPQQDAPTLSQQPPQQLAPSQQPRAQQPTPIDSSRVTETLIREDIQVEDLEDQVEVAPATPPRAAIDASTPPLEAPPVGSSDGAPDDQTFAAYDTAYVLYHEKRYRQAEASFQDFVGRFPDSDLTDNAQFWIGECRYARGDFEGALEAFSATVANYPQGNKVPDALLKAGKCLQALGRNDQARQTYLEVQRRFPGTAIALAAKERLAELE